MLPGCRMSPTTLLWNHCSFFFPKLGYHWGWDRRPGMNPKLTPYACKGKSAIVQQNANFVELFASLCSPIQVVINESIIGNHSTHLCSGRQHILPEGGCINLSYLVYFLLLFLFLYKYLSIMLLFHWDKCGPSAEEQYKLALTPTSPLPTQSLEALFNAKTKQLGNF